MNNTLKFIRLDSTAVAPTRGTPGSAGVDVTVTHLKKVENGVHYFGTGLSVRVPEGCYSLLYPRSSLPKNGWMLANGVGVIDADYQGELIVALVRHNTHPDVQKWELHTVDNHNYNLPLKAVQLVVVNDPRVTNYNIELVDSAEFIEEATKRGVGGFGSTGN
jgi:dUTP pyrophosphatase